MSLRAEQGADQEQRGIQAYMFVSNQPGSRVVGFHGPQAFELPMTRAGP